jgi:1,2-phenylacetyl-CoA epoxidase catalytic subunit
MHNHVSLEDYLAAGGKLSSPTNVNARYRGEIMRLMAIFVDSEMAGAAGFADCINTAPGLKERMIAARIVLEKFGHAQRVLNLMEEFGANTSRYVVQHPWAERRERDADLGMQRVGRDMRLNIFHYPILGWCDAVTMNTLMGSATVIQLEELRQCSYQPLADAMADIVPLEQRHAELGRVGLQLLLAEGFDKATAQASVDYWYPRVAASFGRIGTERFAIYRKFGLRQHSNEELLARWQTVIRRSLTELELSITG